MGRPVMMLKWFWKERTVDFGRPLWRSAAAANSHFEAELRRMLLQVLRLTLISLFVFTVFCLMHFQLAGKCI